jgi:hypothetical protein
MEKLRTLFADKRVISVVGIVRVAKSSMRIFEFEEFVAMLARVARANFFAKDAYAWLSEPRRKESGKAANAY